MLNLMMRKVFFMLLKFSDGVTVDTSGPLRPLKLNDGWYVVGEGSLIPVQSYEEVREFIKKLKK